MKSFLGLLTAVSLSGIMGVNVVSCQQEQSGHGGKNGKRTDEISPKFLWVGIGDNKMFININFIHHLKEELIDGKKVLNLYYIAFRNVKEYLKTIEINKEQWNYIIFYWNTN